ncbi:HAMP domain-containing sensor histidine kinase [Paucibacter sp. APW11]|uniref:histidine kinase n=1 Tax=Roseateles aquae TaxID=3077235 RepID=A0ABU3P8N4_9BURK|nr:HAMP domain-containing sensor histidine kinase [Paucibacter sp. APW11]MDT8998935.1 HAMP domain-containing sensor histidine kinase [Paucibacter sp. APW11]
MDPSPTLPPQPPATPPSGELQALLHGLRHTMLFRQTAAERPDLDALRRLAGDSADRLEIDALELLYLPPQAIDQARSLLPRAAELLAQAQQRGAPHAEAAAWRAIYWLQLQLKLFAAALHSIAMAIRVYEQVGEHELVFALMASRCTLLYSAEMVTELREAARQLLQQADRLDPIQHHQILNCAASAAYFLAMELEQDGGSEAQSAPLWQECVALHRQALAMAEKLDLPLQSSVSRMNLAIVSATRGDLALCEPLLAKLALGVTAQLPGAEQWIAHCRLLMRCHQGDPTEVWPELLALQETLNEPAMALPGLREAHLRAIERFGLRWGHVDAALQASRLQLQLRCQQTRDLGQALGETVQEVMEHPRLLFENEALSRQGDALQHSLLERNAELQRALRKLEAEAEVRQAAEQALQRTHDDLERQVQARSAELERAMRQLMAQERQLALSRMVAGMAHEMNTPLDTARMAASAIQESSRELRQRLAESGLKRAQLEQLDAVLAQGLALMQRALDRVTQLRQRFASVTQNAAQEPAQRFDAVELIEAMARGWHALLHQRSVRLQLDLPGQAELMGHPDALRQVLQQLLENSLQHGLSGRSDGVLTLALRDEGVSWLLGWADNGCGIPAQHLPRVFEPFFTTQLGRSGTGLGLSSVHSLVVDLMGGELQLHSEPGRGTSLQIRLAKPGLAVKASRQTSTSGSAR